MKSLNMQNVILEIHVAWELSYIKFASPFVNYVVYWNATIGHNLLADKMCLLRFVGMVLYLVIHYPF